MPVRWTNTTTTEIPPFENLANVNPPRERKLHGDSVIPRSSVSSPPPKSIAAGGKSGPAPSGTNSSMELPGRTTPSLQLPLPEFSLNGNSPDGCLDIIPQPHSSPPHRGWSRRPVPDAEAPQVQGDGDNAEEERKRSISLFVKRS
jgi:hypothetical protein